MSPIVLRRWGLVMAAISVVSGASALVLFATGDEGFSSEVLVFCWLLVSFTLTGAALVARRPEEPVGWLVALVGFLASLNVLADEVMEALVTAGVAAPWPQFFYDTTQVVSAFSERLRDEIDLEGLNTDLSTVVGATLRPATVSLVLVGEEAR